MSFELTPDSHPQAQSGTDSAATMAQKAMELTEQHFRKAQAADQIGTWEWDPVTGQSTISPELHAMFGTDPSHSDHMKVWQERVHPEDRARMPALFEAANRTGVMEFEYRYNHPGSGLRWFYCKGSRMRDGARIFGIVMDVTDRKRVAQAGLLLAAIVQSSDDAIVSKDLNGSITSWNPAAQKMFGYTPEEIIGKHITTIIPPELHSDEDLILGKIRRGEKIDHYETVRATKTGERIHVSLTVSPVRDESGRVIGAAKIARDVSQRRKAEDALRISEKLASVGRLAATVAHEINNPLAAVVNLIYLIKNSPGLPASVSQYVKIAEEELNRVSALTRQTLGFYREERGAAAIQLGVVAGNLISVFSPKARNKAVNVRLQIRSDPKIHAVQGEMRQLVANLLGNSMDAVPRNGSIVVRISSAVRWKNNVHRPGVRLTIADSGPGIPAAVRTRIFEPFFTTKENVGTGLGLWICKNIAEQHEGSLGMRTCTDPGRSWTVFSVCIPAANSAQDAVLNPATAVSF